MTSQKYEAIKEAVKRTQKIYALKFIGQDNFYIEWTFANIYSIDWIKANYKVIKKTRNFSRYIKNYQTLKSPYPIDELWILEYK